MENVITKVDKRWEGGLPHSKESIEVYEFLKQMDSLNHNVFDFKDGGDGDNGEYLLYLLDMYFETKQQSPIHEVNPND